MNRQALDSDVLLPNILKTLDKNTLYKITITSRTFHSNIDLLVGTPEQLSNFSGNVRVLSVEKFNESLDYYTRTNHGYYECRK
jgi:hypothetical protein